MRFAAFDLGTNVFNLLLADLPGDGTCRYLVEKKAASKIGDAVEDGAFGEEAFRRATAALDILFATLEEYGGADRTAVCCTSAFREASNGKEFAERLSRRYGVRFDVIPGSREAELVYKGVCDSLPPFQGRVLILDIGGGSNEFIIADSDGILWKKSYRLGMAFMRGKFMPSEPIAPEEIRAVEEYCGRELTDFREAFDRYRPQLLIGTSGSFDTFRDLLTGCRSGDALSMKIAFEDYEELHARLIASVREDRMAMPGMSPVRVDYIVLASVFTKFVLEMTGLKNVVQSSYSLKEGLVAEQKRLAPDNKIKKEI